jgi:hypothetical protein
MTRGCPLIDDMKARRLFESQNGKSSGLVMAGLVPAIHVFTS